MWSLKSPWKVLEKWLQFFVCLWLASHRCASPSFLGALSSSRILNSHGSKYRDKLNSFLDPVLQTTGRSRFVRCWHAKTDGWAASTFHSNCDGKGPTVTIVQVGSYIFGAYSDKSWSSPSKYISNISVSCHFSLQKRSMSHIIVWARSTVYR